MNETYTYTARSVENPERVVTFTLHDSRMSVGVGAPLEHVERALEITEKGEEEAEETESQAKPKLWLKPLAVSLVERSTRPFGIGDVDARATDDWLQVKAWIRAGGLRLAPITLIDGQVDNAEAAHAFVEEVAERKAGLGGPSIFGLLDYWATWMVAGVLMIVLLQIWRRRGSDEE